jgi:hypothetical protein
MIVAARSSSDVSWQLMHQNSESNRKGMYSPVDDETRTNADFELTNPDNQKIFVFSGLVPLMIERYGFFGGKGTPCRVEPSDIIKLPGLPVKVSK